MNSTKIGEGRGTRIGRGRRHKKNAPTAAHYCGLVSIDLVSLCGGFLVLPGFPCICVSVMAAGEKDESATGPLLVTKRKIRRTGDGKNGNQGRW